MSKGVDRNNDAILRLYRRQYEAEMTRRALEERVKSLERIAADHAQQLQCGACGHTWTVGQLNPLGVWGGPIAGFRCIVCDLEYFRPLDKLTPHEAELVRVTEGKET